MEKFKRFARWLEVLLWLGCAAYLFPKAYERISSYLELSTGGPGVQEGRVASPLRLGSLTASGFAQGSAVRLGESPSTHYGDARWTNADQHFGELVDDIPEAEYDPSLAHAAREVAQVFASTNKVPEHGAFMFLLNAAGAADWGVKQALMLTTQTGDEPVRERLLNLLATEQTSARPARVGIGEVLQLGVPPRRSIAILVSRSDLYIDRTPRELFAGTTLSLSGLLPRGAERLSVLRLGPDGLMTTLESVIEDERFRVEVPAGIHRGTVWVELIASMQNGPTPLAQMGFYVGTQLPTEWTGVAHGEEETIRTPAEAEELALQLLLRDRRQNGVAPLLRDESLDGVARAHCAEMQEEGYFGHHSPYTGGVRDRINDAGLNFKSVGENLARNTSIGSAQEGLMFSIGHRRNCLSERFSAVGIGVSMAENNGKRVWHLCQVFGSR